VDTKSFKDAGESTAALVGKMPAEGFVVKTVDGELSPRKDFEQFLSSAL
jgi:hypothetical protein